MTDPHDPRQFRQWIRFAADGSIASVHEHSAETEQPAPDFVETTHLFPFDTTVLKIDPALVVALNAAHEDVAKKSAELNAARAVAQQAHVDLKVATTNAGLQQKAQS